MLVLSVNNRYTGLVSANNRYGENMSRKFFNRGGYFLNREGEGVILSAHFAQETIGPSIIQEKLDFSIC